MSRFTLAALAALLAVSPAAAKSLHPAEVGTIFCYGVLSEDLAPALAIMTDELRGLVEKKGADTVSWQGDAGPADTCKPVGARGSVDAPEVVLSYGFRDPSRRSFSDTLVMRFVDERLRIDDIKFAAGPTLRQQLQAP